MTSKLTSEFVWTEIEKGLFGVLGMVTAQNESRTVGIVYVVRNGRFYISSWKNAWKVQHIARNPHVSMTIPIHKRIFFLPWIKIPAATITFSGIAKVLDPQETPTEIVQAIFKGMADNESLMAESCLIEVTPVKDFLTYGVGIPLMQMRDTKLARGRVPVAVEPAFFEDVEQVQEI